MIRGCVEVPASWRCEASQDYENVWCTTPEGGDLSIWVTDYAALPSLPELEIWFSSVLDEPDSGWRDISQARGERRYPGDRVCHRVWVDARWSEDNTQARVLYYMCTLDTQNTIHIFAARPDDTGQPSDKDLNTIVSSHR